MGNAVLRLLCCKDNGDDMRYIPISKPEECCNDNNTTNKASKGSYFSRRKAIPISSATQCTDRVSAKSDFDYDSLSNYSCLQTSSPSQSPLLIGGPRFTHGRQQNNYSRRDYGTCESYQDYAATFYYKGGELYSKDHDLKLTIPEGAVKIGDSVKLSVAVSLYPPKHQADMHVVSPYYRIRATESYQFQKPVQVEFEHFAVVTAACDPSHYQLLCCEDDDESYTMRPADYELSFTVRDDISWCAFETDHFCYYCLKQGCKDPKVKRICALYLKPVGYECLDHFVVQVWFSLVITKCLKRNKELYLKKNLILDDVYNYIFEASCDKTSTSYFNLNYEQITNGWSMDNSRHTEIQTKDINFYNDYKDHATLEVAEENSLFPPRFIINVTRNSVCPTNLNTNIIISLHNDKETKSIPFKLFVPTSYMIIKSSSSSKDTSLPSIDHHQCGKIKPTLQKLAVFLPKVSSYWKEIAAQLGIPHHKISTFDRNNPNNINGKCQDVFAFWLESVTSPCWCHFVQALYIFGLHEVAKEAAVHLENVHQIESKTMPPDIAESYYKVNIRQLTSHLKKIPEDNLFTFITNLFPKNVAIDIIKDIRYSNRTTEENVKRISKEYLKEKDPSWVRVYRALKDAECDDLAECVAACFLPL